MRTCTDPTLGGSVCVEVAKEETKSCNDFECPDSKYYFIVIQTVKNDYTLGIKKRDLPGKFKVLASTIIF